MAKIDSYIASSINFMKKYTISYIKALLLPITAGIIGFLAVLLSFLHPIMAILSLFISIPCVCYSFWRGYIATYALNFAAYDLYKRSEEKTFNDYIKLINQNELAKYLVFCAIISIIFYIPAIFIIYKSFDFNNISADAFIQNPMSIFENIPGMLSGIGLIILISILLLPFLNFMHQALFFKKEKENFFQLFINCYKLQNLTGIILSFVFSCLGGILTYFGPFYIIVALLCNLLTFSINTFWYSDAVDKK